MRARTDLKPRKIRTVDETVKAIFDDAKLKAIGNEMTAQEREEIRKRLEEEGFPFASDEEMQAI